MSSLLGLVVGLAMTVAVPSVVCLLIALISLWGTPTDQRPAIIYALADFARALLFRGGRSPTRSESEMRASDDE